MEVDSGTQDDSPYSPAYTETGKCAHDRPRGNEGTDARDRKCAYSCQEAECPANNPAGGRAFRSFSVLLMGESAGAFIIREQYGDRLVGETFRQQLIHRRFSGGWRFVNTENGNVFAGHKVLL
jgi:hypothetical protein